MRIAVLALQGAFIEHEATLSRLGVDSFEIRQLADLDRSFDGLILPGGESTVQGKLLRELNLAAPLRARIAEGLPTFGTCAGLILLADTIAGGETPHLAVMPITAHRNAYGRQLGSFTTIAPFATLGDVPMTFIRAPYIESAHQDVEILATVNDKIVAARHNRLLACAFHPELTDNTRVHEYFLDMVRERKG